MKEMMANLQAKAKANREAKKGEARVSPLPPPQPSVVHSLRKTAYTLFLHLINLHVPASIPCLVPTIALPTIAHAYSSPF